MARERLTRRRVLRTVAGGGAAGVLVGGAAGRDERATPRIVGTATREARREAKRRAESVKRVLSFGAIGDAVAGRFSDRAAAELRRRDDVRYVERDGAMYAIHHKDGHDGGPSGGGNSDTSQTLPWGVDRVDAEVAHAEGDTGGGADVAIIDTGIDDDHPDLAANVGEGKAFVDCRGRNCNYSWSDDNDHGTHCAGIAAALDNDRGVVGVAPAATLHAAKVLDRNGRGTWSDVAAGVKWTADQGYDVGSMSLGGGYSETVRDACRYAYDRGVLLVAAAGNSGPCTDCVGYPAAYGTVVAVSATSDDDTLASFSSTGPEVELAAPGERVYSTVIGGYDTFSGTSMACPHVSGGGGLLMANGYTHTEARDRLTATAEDLGLPSTDQGAGLLDVAAALSYGSSDNL